jgi:hypothetical protein
LENNKTNKRRLDIMVDIETLGNDPYATIIAIAAKAFTLNSNDKVALDTSYYNIANVTKGRISVEGNTLKWWLNTDMELFKSFINSDSDLSPIDLIRNFGDWLTSLCNEYDVYLWGNGMLYDNNKLKHKMEDYDLKYPVYYRNDRDMRTIVDLASTSLSDNPCTYEEFLEKYSSKDLRKHDPLNDVVNQIGIVQTAYKIIFKI